MNAVEQNRPLSPTWLRWFILCLLVVGMVFRFVNLNHKVYGRDEVSTSLRASGYTERDVRQEMLQNQVFLAQELLRFQQIKPDSTPIDTVRSLALEHPQQPPLYALLNRVWVQGLGEPIQAIFGSPVTASRLLSALLSLLALPFMYVLAWELFASYAVALLATTFLAVSPWYVLVAQTACESSLLVLTVIASHVWLLRASRLAAVPQSRSRDVLRRSPSTWQHWSLYGLTATLGLYIHPVFALTLLGHAIWIMWHPIAVRQRTSVKHMTGFWLSLLVAGLLYAPWLVVWLASLSRPATIHWATGVPDLIALAKHWTFSLTALFLDLDSADHAGTVGLRVFMVGLILLAFYTLYRRRDRAGKFVLSTTIVPFVVLLLMDVAFSNPRSTVNRDLVLCYPGVQLAIAAFLATRLAPKPHYLSARPPRSVGSSRVALRVTPYTGTLINRWFWRFVLLVLLTASLLSCTVSAASFTWWHKDQSYFNAAVADRINAEPSPLLLSEVGDDSSHLDDVISLSYRLNPNVRMLLLTHDANGITAQHVWSQADSATVVVFRPSPSLRDALERSRGSLQPFLPEADVWLVPER